MAGSTEQLPGLDFVELEKQFGPQPPFPDEFQPIALSLVDDFETASLPVAERCLTEVDNLNRNRRSDGTRDPSVLGDVYQNLFTAMSEAAMPYHVTKTEHVYAPALNTYMWLGRTAIENAASGRSYHKHPAALKRVEVEVDEARDAEANLKPGMTKIFISPRMSAADAPLEVAKAEHLGVDDSVRVSNAITNEPGEITHRKLESVLARDIPLPAWVAMLEDPNNIFGKSITVEQPDSALSVMKTHRELEVPTEALPEGVVTVIEAVLNYIYDPKLRASVEQQLARFRSGQAEMDAEAADGAKRWLEFEVSLADSLHEGKATLEIEAFINSMQSVWGEKDLAVILAHQRPGSAHYTMSRELAVVVEKAKQNLLWVPAAVLTGNDKVLEQMTTADVERITRDATYLKTIASAGASRSEVRMLEAQLNRNVAQQNVKVGGGCAGETDTEFKVGDSVVVFKDAITKALEAAGIVTSESKTGKITKGSCVVKTCPTRPNKVDVGECGVCIERCQKKYYDKGRDPTKVGIVTKAVGESTTKGEVYFVTPPKEKPEPRVLPVKSKKTTSTSSATGNQTVSYIL